MRWIPKGVPNDELTFSGSRIPMLILFRKGHWEAHPMGLGQCFLIA